jgi:hypothetical protein
MTGIAFADVPNTPFDPADHPRDYFESLEGMRVLISDAVVVSRREGKVLYAVSRAALQPAELTAGGLPKSIPGHIFPEVVKVRLSSAQTESLVMEAGFGLGDLTGIVGYDAGEIIVQLDHVLTQSDITQVERPAAEGPEGDGFRFATFNAENLSTTTPNLKVKRIAEQITGPLGAPELIALQEFRTTTVRALPGSSRRKPRWPSSCRQSSTRAVPPTRRSGSTRPCPMSMVVRREAISATPTCCGLTAVLSSERSSACSTRTICATRTPTPSI